MTLSSALQSAVVAFLVMEREMGQKTYRHLHHQIDSIRISHFALQLDFSVARRLGALLDMLMTLNFQRLCTLH